MAITFAYAFIVVSFLPIIPPIYRLVFWGFPRVPKINVAKKTKKGVGVHNFREVADDKIFQR